MAVLLVCTQQPLATLRRNRKTCTAVKCYQAGKKTKEDPVILSSSPLLALKRSFFSAREQGFIDILLKLRFSPLKELDRWGGLHESFAQGWWRVTGGEDRVFVIVL